ncbi:hypothetical protein BDV12DRAFT_167664 [Aspergillus spectabilis]
MQSVRQLYATITYQRVYFLFSKPSAPITRSVRCYSNLEDEKESRIEKPSSSDSTEGKSSGKDPAHKEYRDLSGTLSDSKERQKYYSLKNYRQGPNTESGELASKDDKEGVSTHNKDIENRFEKG